VLAQYHMPKIGYLDPSRPIFQTWWSIAGPKLPKTETYLTPTIIIAPMTPDEFEQIKTKVRLNPNLAPSHGMWAILYPPRDEVQSRHRLQIDVNASDDEGAIAAARQIADALLFSLSLVVPGLRYHADFRKLRRHDHAGERTPWSETVALVSYADPEPLGESEIIQTRSFMNIIKDDAVAESAYIHLLSAWRLQDNMGSKPLARSILQHYVLSIEAITTGLMTRLRRATTDKLRLEERSFANEFAKLFMSRSDKPKAIREALTKLREISLTNMLPGIAKAAEILGLSEDAKFRAIEMYRLRSKSLSHPGKKADDDIQSWLSQIGGERCLADVTAREFLEKYCEHTG